MVRSMAWAFERERIPAGTEAGLMIALLAPDSALASNRPVSKVKRFLRFVSLAQRLFSIVSWLEILQFDPFTRCM